MYVNLQWVSPKQYFRLSFSPSWLAAWESRTNDTWRWPCHQCVQSGFWGARPQSPWRACFLEQDKWLVNLFDSWFIDRLEWSTCLTVRLIGKNDFWNETNGVCFSDWLNCWLINWWSSLTDWLIGKHVLGVREMFVFVIEC